MERYSFQHNAGDTPGTKLYVASSEATGARLIGVSVGIAEGLGANVANLLLRRIQVQATGFFAKGVAVDSASPPSTMGWVIPFSEPTYYPGNVMSASLTGHTTFRWQVDPAQGIVFPDSTGSGIGMVLAKNGQRNVPGLKWQMRVEWEE